MKPAIPDETLPPWAGTPFEAPLMRIKNPAADEEKNARVREHVYREVQEAGRCFRDEVPSRQFHPSKEAAKRRKLAQKCENLASELRNYDSATTDTLIAAAEGFRLDADMFAEQTNRRKRHERHPATQHILLAMGRIHQHTGRWHDPELAMMLRFAGLNQYTPDRLRVLRADTR